MYSREHKIRLKIQTLKIKKFIGRYITLLKIIYEKYNYKEKKTTRLKCTVNSKILQKHKQNETDKFISYNSILIQQCSQNNNSKNNNNEEEKDDLVFHRNQLI